MLIGLTGKTGSGKSTAATIFKKLGAFVADCDEIAHRIIENSNVKENLRNEFSDIIFNSDGTVNRKKLGSIVFSDSEKLLILNRIMHKAVSDEALKMCEQSGKEICIIDGSELEASGLYKKCKYTIVVTADEATRLNRITKRDGIDRESALLRIKAQKDFTKEAIFIDNSGSLSSLENTITSLFNKFITERKQEI